jgi:hypothetical protein
MNPYLAKNIKWVAVTPVIDAAVAYAVKDALSVAIEIPEAARYFGGGGIIQSVVLTDQGDEGKSVDVAFFTATVTAVKNGAFTPTDAQLLTYLGSARVTTFASFTDNGAGETHNVGIPFKCSAASTSLFAVIVAREAVTYDAADAVTLKVGIVQD